jgi:two-component system sensor histidine kinase PhcS
MHEIGNPLNFTMTALEVASADAEDDPDLQECFTDMGEGLTRIKDILADLRTFAYPTTAESSRPVAIAGLVSSALRLTGSEVKDISVEVKTPAEHTARGSRSQLLHVIMNLIVNAARAIHDRADLDSEQGCIRIISSDQDNHVTISVMDNGVGIPDAIKDRIFDPFFTTRDVQQGMGLGLSLCRTIIDHHKGGITVDSESGRGTIMTLSLPTAFSEDRS